MKLSLKMFSLAVFAIPQSIYGEATNFHQLGKVLAKGMYKFHLWEDFEPDEICNKVLCKEDGKECVENLGCLDDAEACKETCNEEDCYRSCEEAFEFCASNCTASFEMCVEEGHPELDLCLDCFNKTDEGDYSAFCEDLFDDFDKLEGSKEEVDKDKDDGKWEDLEPDEICNKVLCKEDGKECVENLGCLDDAEACKETCNEEDCYRSCEEAFEFCASNCTASFEMCVEEGHPELDLCLDCFNKTDEGDYSAFCEDLFDDFDQLEGSKDGDDKDKDDGKWEDLEPDEICNKVLCKEDGKECVENLGCLDDAEACKETCNKEDWQCYRSCEEAFEFCASNCTASFEMCVEEGHPELDLCLDCFNKTDEGDYSAFCEDLFDDFDKLEGSKDEDKENEGDDGEGSFDDSEDEKEDDRNTFNDDAHEGADEAEIESSVRDEPTEIQSAGEHANDDASSGAGLRGSSNDSDSGASSSAAINSDELHILTFGFVTVGVYVLLM
eukprot:CAMPEP_0196825906 /NCGR_PEP_ID=MMETSP1362-20130617/93329_1 /TAXON_ID=163516 /ORGANISM="Leptocylindrus danicus, Strain CCMP1856" /LENGTH=496 /DNA_ID=CAMNT_0042206415 /DNA_START=133 /DNA_END=1623 /DNA_ORIENTATION=+